MEANTQWVDFLRNIGKLAVFLEARRFIRP